MLRGSWIFPMLAVLVGSALSAFAGVEDRPINGIAEMNGRIVAVGGFMEDSAVIFETDERSPWNRLSPPNSNGLWSVRVGPDKLVAVGYKGVVLESNAPNLWTVAATLTEEHWLFDVCPSPLGWVTGGVGGLYFSPDARRWIQTDADSNVYGLCYGGGQFVAVGYGGSIRTSVDGKSWTSRDSNIRNILRSVAYGNGLYIAVGGEGQHAMTISSDGIHWQPSSSGSNAQLMDICFANGVFILVGGRWHSSDRKWTAGTVEFSRDGKNWVTYFVEDASIYKTVTASGADWLIAGDGDYVGLVRESDDGLVISDLLVNGKDTRVPQTPLAPRIKIPDLRIAVEDDQIVLRWKSEHGLRYSLRRSRDLIKWEDTGHVFAGTGNELEHREPMEPDQRATFFRLEIRANEAP